MKVRPSAEHRARRSPGHSQPPPSRGQRRLYLAQSALQFPQEVVITQVNCLVVNVINPKFQFLHHFEVVVDDELFGKLRAEAVLDLLRPIRLLGKFESLGERVYEMTFLQTLGLHSVALVHWH